jgi:hypothetical protein
MVVIVCNNEVHAQGLMDRLIDTLVKKGVRFVAASSMEVGFLGGAVLFMPARSPDLDGCGFGRPPRGYSHETVVFWDHWTIEATYREILDAWCEFDEFAWVEPAKVKLEGNHGT